VGNVEAGLLNALPYIAACIAMVLWGRHSDRTRERVWHNAIPMAAAVFAMVATLFVADLAVNMVLLTLRRGRRAAVSSFPRLLSPPRLCGCVPSEAVEPCGIL
jgi:MFS family permease